MKTKDKETITVRALINAPVNKVWNLWTDPRHIVHWNNASEDWHTPRAENDLRTGGKFLSRMEARDGSDGFDFTGRYDKVEQHRLIEYTLDDGRKVFVSFDSKENDTTVTETFEAEHTHPAEMQQAGWQAILNNFKDYAEASYKPEVMHFEISIDANAEKVFKTMLDEKKYAEWTSVFNPASHFRGSWETGSKILFLGEDRDGKMGGMVSRIKENIPNRFVGIEHLGIVQDGKEIMSGPKSREWSGARENYSFVENNGQTLLSVDVDVSQKYISYFKETWPRALEKLRSICET